MFSTKSLELDIILKLIRKHAHSQSAINQIETMPIMTNLAQVKSYLSIVNELSLMLSHTGQLPFIDDYDVYSLINRIKIKQVLSVSDVLTLRLLVSMENSFYTFLTNLPKVEFETIYGLINNLVKHPQVLKMIDSIMNIDGEIIDSASAELKIIRTQLKVKKNSLTTLAGRLLTKYEKYLSEPIITKRNDRTVILVKESFRNTVKGVVHDVSASGLTVYIEPLEIKELQDSIEGLQISEQNEIFRILQELTYNLFPFIDSLNHNINCFIEIDCYQAKAIYANLINAIMPKVVSDGLIDLKQARHPLIDARKVVPINIKIEKNEKVVLITGPNTGGKTVALKTLGLLCLMVQLGILIPVAEGSTVNVFDAVFADIGDEQSIEQSLSTFSSHMTKIRVMLDNIGANQLILLDEIGSGTDPVEGVALATAILDYIRKYPIKAMVTTHYSELKLYALKHPDVLNASVAFDFETLKPLYKLQLGIAGTSQAIDIAKKLGINDEILLNARKYVAKEENPLSVQLSSISEKATQLAKDDETLKQKIADYDLLIANLEQKQANFEKKKEEVLNVIRQKEQKEINKLKKELTNLINELSKKDVLSFAEASSIKGKINKDIKSDEISDDEPLKVGDYVLIIAYDQVGIIKAIKQDKYIVKFGNFELSFNGHQLRKTTKPVLVKPKATATQTTAINTNTTFNGDVDLRGKRVEEIYELIDRAIDNAKLANFSTVRIVHGHGTGAIKTAVQAYVKKHKDIKSSRFGKQGEGFMGATIISLK